MSAHTPGPMICRECKLPIPPACASMVCSCAHPKPPKPTDNDLTLDDFKWEDN